MRNHTPIPITQFNGLWARGDNDSVPSDHFSDCNNIDFSQTSVFTRAPFAKAFNRLGFTPGRTVVYSNNITHKTYFLILDPIGGNLYSMQISPIVGGPVLILTVPGMTDFGFANFFGRAYISPSNGITGISGQLVQVYDGTLLWPAAGQTPALGTFNVTNVVLTGDIDGGNHWFGVSYLTKSGFITPFQVIGAPLLVPQDRFVTLNNIPIGPVGTIKRILIASKVTSSLITDVRQVTFYFIDNTFGTINDNTTTTINITFSDAQLVEDASYLQGLAQKIDAGVFLGAYHNRLVVGGAVLDSSIVTAGTFPPSLTAAAAGDPSTLKFSLPGDPESIDTVGGINQIDPSHSISIIDAFGNSQPIGVTALQEYRDVCYVGKINKFYGLSDNGSDPSSWIPTTIDEGIGCFPHGITTILDTGGVNIDAFFVADKTGLYFFNGNFQKPEVSWKIADLWARIQKTYNPTAPFNNLMHFVNDSVRKKIYISLQFEPGVMVPLSANTPEDSDGLDFSTLASISTQLNTFEPNTSKVVNVQTNTVAGGFVNQPITTQPPPVFIPDPLTDSVSGLLKALGLSAPGTTVIPPPVITNNSLPFNVNNGVIPNIILVCDYQNANISTGLYTTPLYTTVRWSKWVFNTTQYSPAALVLYDDGTKVNFYMFNLVDQLIYLFNGNANQKELISTPYFDTALLGDNEDSINHFGQIKMIVKSDGASVISPAVINRDNTRMIRCKGLKIGPNPGVEPVFLANFNAQKAKIRVQTNIGGTFNISKLIAYLKPVWSSLPQ